METGVWETLAAISDMFITYRAQENRKKVWLTQEKEKKRERLDAEQVGEFHALEGHAF